MYMKKYNKQDIASLAIAGVLLVIGVFTVAIVSFGVVTGVDQIEPQKTAAVQTQDFDYNDYISSGKSYIPRDLNTIEPAAGGEKQRHIQLFEETYQLQSTEK